MIFPDQLLRPKVRKISVFVLAFIDFGCSIHTRLPDAPVSKLNRPAGGHSVCRRFWERGFTDSGYQPFIEHQAVQYITRSLPPAVKPRVWLIKKKKGQTSRSPSKPDY
jgi:hypothetical protein